MNSTVKTTIFCIVCIVISIVFIIVLSSKKENGKVNKRYILQNVFNIPLALSGLSINFIEPHDDPMLGLWAIGFILLLIPTAIGYLIFAFIMPVADIVKKRPRPTAYRINIILLIGELILAPLMLL